MQSLIQAQCIGISTLRSAARAFSSSGAQRGHYETLGVSHNATKHQIKTQYYKLSKRYHPDVTNDPDSKSAFQAVTEAYAVLGDENRRRTYDRSLTDTPFGRTAFHAHWLHETRHRGATHAWEQHPNRAWQRRSQRHAYPSRSANRNPERAAPHDEFHAHHHHHHHHARTQPPRATATSRPGHSDADRVRRESSLWRALQVLGIVLIVTMLGGWRSAAG